MSVGIKLLENVGPVLPIPGPTAAAVLQKVLEAADQVGGRGWAGGCRG